MTLYVRIASSNEIAYEWNHFKDQFDKDGNLIFVEDEKHLREDGWYPIEREPDREAGEYLEHDEQNDCIVIKKREKSIEELEIERQMTVKRQLVAELPDIILQNKDNPEALVQALCDRAKQIETEIISDHERNPKTV